MDYERYVEDFNRNDERATVERWFTEDLVVEVPGQVIRGPEDWIAFLEASHAGGVRETLHPVAVLQGDGLVLAEVDIAFVDCGRAAGLPTRAAEAGRAGDVQVLRRLPPA